MLHLLQYILGIIFSCFGAILLLRAWLHYWALSPRHPLCEFVRRITDWLVVPHQPRRSHEGWCTLVGAAFRSGRRSCGRLGASHDRASAGDPDWPHHCSLCNDGPLGA